MAATATRRRIRVCLVAALGIFALFSARLFQIQGVDAQAYAAMAVQLGTATTKVPAPRGAILDRNGAELASSVDGLSITADPTLTGEQAPQIARILFEHLGEHIDYFETIDALRKPDSRFVYIVRDLPAAEVTEAVNAVSAGGHTGVFTEKEVLRSYPGGKLAANLIGITNSEGEGVSGLELAFNEELTGTDGSSTFEVSPYGQRIPMAESSIVDMVAGTSVKSTIDRDLQWYADERLAEAVKSAGADYGLALTMDTKTCQIVQLSQAPTYNPEDRSSINSATSVSRALQTVYEPGSVMKPITMAALADQGLVNADTKIRVPSQLFIDNFPIGDHWDHGVINLTAAGVIAKSSNLGTIVAAQQMDNQTFYDYLTDFGFGETTGLGLPGESAGIIAAPDDWTAAKHATTSFGQGISVTAVQMVRAIGAIANSGTMCTPTVVDALIAPDGTEEEVKPGPTRQVVSPDAAAETVRMMEAVTASESSLARIDGYRVAGKTGTAWRVNPDTGTYIRGQNTISFVGFAPADNPRFVTYVVIDNPPSDATGGSLAAPVFQDIMSMALEHFAVTPTGSAAPDVAQEW